MPSAPSRFEVDHLHRLMIQASVEAAQLDQRVEQERKADGLWPVLRQWSEAAAALEEAVERATPALQRDGTPKEQIDRIREALDRLDRRSRQFDPDFDLDECVETWRSLGHEIAQLSGPQRDALVRLLQHHKPDTDRATATLSEARPNDDLVREQHRKVVALQAERDRARAKYERLRQSFLQGQRDWEDAQIPAQQYEVKKPPLPDLRLLGRQGASPVIVRLPLPRAPGPGPAAIAKPKQAEEKKPATRRKWRGSGRITLERIERVGGYPTSQDGIGRGPQTAGIWFRADHLQDTVLIQGTSAIELGCGTHLDVSPSVQIFSAFPGQPVRGKISLLLVASGGHPGAVTPRSAQTAAMLAAGAGAGAVVARLGALGRALQAAIREAIEDAAAKVFARAQPKAPPHVGPRPHASAAEHHLARFDHVLGTLLFEARAVRGARQASLPLQRQIDRGHQQRDLVAARLEKTLSHLATASHRTLTDPRAGRMRAHLARMDSLLARLHGKTGEELLEGAGAVSSILRQMISMAARAGGAPHMAELRKLIEERKAELQRISQAQLAAGLPRRGASGLDEPEKPQAARGALDMARPGAASTQGALGTALERRFERLPAPLETSAFAAHLSQTGPPRALRDDAQGGHGLPIGPAAQHYLAARGSSDLWSAVATFNALVGEGHQPRFSFGSWLKKSVSDHASSALQAVQQTVTQATGAATALAVAAPAGMTSLASIGFDAGRRAASPLAGLVRGAARGLGGTTTSARSSALRAAEIVGRSTSGGVRHAGHALAQVVGPGVHAARGAASWAGRKAGAAADWTRHRAQAGPHWLGEKVHSGLGIGALQSGASALASGGSLEDALKGAAGGSLDAFDPGAFHALKKLKAFTTAEKLLHDKDLSKAERQLLQTQKRAAPLRALEMAMSNPGARRTVGALEQATSRGVRGGIWVSGKAAKAQHALDKVVGAGDKLHGALSQVHDLAPSLADVLGDNAAGHLVDQVGDRAGESDDRLEKALGYGHAASSTLSSYRGYLDKGLGFAGVKDPARAYEKMMARRELRSGKEGALERVAQLKLEDHRRKHPERHPETATHHEGRHRDEKRSPQGRDPGRSIRHGLQAIEKYRKKAIRTGWRIDSGLEKIETVLNKGVAVGTKVDSGLEKLAALAGKVGDMLGDDTALGHLAHQLGEGAAKGQEKLHQALHVAQTGEGLLHKGHQIFHRGLEALQGRPGAHHHAKASPEQAVRNALQWVTAFGKQVTAAIKQVERLMHAGRAREAAERVQELRAMSGQTRVEVTRAVEAAAHDPQLAKQAAGARKLYLKTRAHLLRFIGGLHGLDLEARDAAEVAANRARAGESRAHARTNHDPVGDLIDEILAGDDGRIHVDRGAARGDVRVVDFQEVDSAALDTWIGSGEGVMLFSEVFGAFIPAEGATVVHHRRRGGHAPQEQRGSPPKRGGFFAKVFDRLEGFADRVAGWAKKGSTVLGKGMHYAELGMHGLSQLESAAGKVRGIAGKAESFLEGIGLHTLAGYAGRIGSAAGRADEDARTVHGGLKRADRWMGEGKHVADEAHHGAHAAAGIFHTVGHGRFGAVTSVFKSSRNGDEGGRLSPEKVRLGSVFDEPRRLDVATLSRMESFLGGDFSGVRIHTGHGAAEVTRRFSAEAVTVKDHIFFAPGRFNPASVEGQKLIAHELTHVLQKGRANLDVRTAEGEALHSEHSYGQGPAMETLNLRRPEPGFRLAPDREGMGASSGIHTARRTRSRGHEAGGKDDPPDGEEFLEQISGRVYELLMEDLEHAFESR